MLQSDRIAKKGFRSSNGLHFIGQITLTYRIGAEKFYDLFGAKGDYNLYKEIAHKNGDRALELGVGTARLAIILARDGVEVWGIDNSPHMLKAAERKIAEEPPEVRRRITLKLADVRSFALDKGFPFIYFPTFSFDHCLTREEQLNTLRNIYTHLKPGGVYAFDLAHVTDDDAKKGWFIQRKQLDDEKMVVRSGYHRRKPGGRISSIDLFYEVYVKGVLVDKYHEYGELYIHVPYEIRKLLEENGFTIEAFYGDYKKTPFTEESSMMFIVARRI